MSDSATNRFDIVQSPLSQGATALEASAGTGKTFALSHIVVRYLVEKDISHRSILAVTFTRAASSELRDRIRSLITQALDLLNSPSQENSEPSPLEHIVQRIPSETLPQAQLRLQDALQSFDEFPIFTIDGFFQRILNEHAFETGSLFESEIMTDERPLLEQAIEEAWKSLTFTLTGHAATYFNNHGTLQASAQDILQKKLQHQQLHILPDSPEDSFATLADAYNSETQTLLASIAQFKELLHTELDTLIELISNPPDVFSKTSGPFNTRGKDNMIRAIKQMDNLPPEAIVRDSYILERLPKLAYSTVSGCLKKGKSLPDPLPAESLLRYIDIILKHIEQAQAHTDNLELKFLHDAVSLAEPKLNQLKAQSNVLSYSDLSRLLSNALDSPHAAQLISTLNQKYQVALIDEFQDTSPIQCRIFQTLFDNNKVFLYYIGDPKQSIYRFRGADVFSYLAATNKARKYHLSTNYRSEPELVKAVNHLFALKEHPFLVQGIEYDQVDTPTPYKHPTLQPASPPIKLRTISESLPSAQASATLAKSIANEIIALLQSNDSLGDRPFACSDFAVLVKSNKQARLVKDIFNTARLPSVIMSEKSVYETDIAMHLYQILSALNHPRYEAAGRAALLTPICGHTLQTLINNDTQDALQTSDTANFSHYQSLWRSHGFLAAIEALMSDFQTCERLAKTPDAERTLTDLHHLIELLHQAEHEQSLSPPALLLHYSRQLTSPEATSEEAQLRLESDDQAIQIVTIHKSKGLEYPIVFCPFLWKPTRSSTGPALVHDSQNSMSMIYDLSKSLANERDLEEQAEAIRLMYVAFTRARNRCYLYAAQTNSKSQSPISSLFDNTPASTPEDFAHLAHTLPNLFELEPLSADTPLAKWQPPAPEEQSTLSVGSIAGRVRHLKRHHPATSFSQLSEHGTPHDAFDRHNDPEDNTPLTPDDGCLKGFPRGAQTGNLIHNIMESIIYEDPHSYDEAIIKQLKVQGLFSAENHTKLKSVIETTLSIPLPCEDEPFSLNQTSQTQRLCEPQFLIRTKAAPLNKLKQTAGLDDDHAAPFTLNDGYITGFIDLIFQHNGRYYLLDWKTNTLPAYSQDALEQAMQKNQYRLQYHLYLLALDAYLRQQLGRTYDYDEHFGGVFYLFIRGMAPDSLNGIFCDRPSTEQLATLYQLLLRT